MTFRQLQYSMNKWIEKVSLTDTCRMVKQNTKERCIMQKNLFSATNYERRDEEK